MVADRNDTWVSCPFVGRTTILSLGRNSMDDAFDQDRPVIIVGGRLGPRQPHSAPSHISKIVPPTVHLGPPEKTRTDHSGRGGSPSHISKMVPSTVHSGPRT